MNSAARLVALLFSLFIISLSLSACSKQSITSYQSFAFGTLIEIKTRHDDKRLSDESVAAVFIDFDRMHNEWHAWQPGRLTKINTLLSSSEWIDIDSSMTDLIALIKLSKQYSLLSNELFNPTIGKLINLWGFQGGDPQSPPPADSIKPLLENLPSANDLIIENSRLRSLNPDLQLDLGAIAKGYAVSKGIQSLRRQGIKNALINAGGDLCGIGDQGQRPWRIGIRNPSGEGIIASIDLGKDECVFTSGDYERYFTHNGKRYHHILDPRTGYPANNAKSVTVLHRDGAIADAASTALLIAGPKDWQKIAKKMGVTDIMMIDKAGRIIMTPSMKKRLTLEVETNDHDVIIKELES